MKRVIFLLGCISAFNAYAQDVIVCRDGEEIESKVFKISQTEVEYKKWTNQDGPSYTLDKSKVFMIKYQNGEKDVFKEEPVQQTTTTEGQSGAQGESAPNEPVLATPAANNAELIAEYNNAMYEYPIKLKKKKAYRELGTLGVKESSILSTSEVEISFFQKGLSRYGRYKIGDIIDPPAIYPANAEEKSYSIIIKNKTSRVLYVDKAACFGAESTGQTKIYFDPQEYTVTSVANSGAGASVNLGSVADAVGIGGVLGTLASGVNVGGDKGEYSGYTTTYKDNRILTIPPHGSAALSQDDVMSHPTQKRKIIVTGINEYFDIPNLNLKAGEIRKYTEETTPKTIDYMITYSLDSELRNCYMVSFGVYLKDVFGSSMYYKPKNISPKTIMVN